MEWELLERVGAIMAENHDAYSWLMPVGQVLWGLYALYLVGGIALRSTVWSAKESYSLTKSALGKIFRVVFFIAPPHKDSDVFVEIKKAIFNEANTFWRTGEQTMYFPSLKIVLTSDGVVYKVHLLDQNGSVVENIFPWGFLDDYEKEVVQARVKYLFDSFRRREAKELSDKTVNVIRKQGTSPATATAVGHV